MFKRFTTPTVAVAPVERAGEDFARAGLMAQLEQSEAVSILANCLNSLERRRDLQPLCRLQDREFEDFRRLVRQARGIVRGVHEDVQDEAIEAVAVRLCDAEGVTSFENQFISVQNNYRRQAQSAINTYFAVLEDLV